MLVSKSTETVDIPGEPGEWLSIRGLNWWQLKEASDAMAMTNRKSLVGLDRETMIALQEARTVTAVPAAITDAFKDPMADYDRFTLLRGGIVDWSYTDALSVETVRDLDDDTADWAARLILAKSRIADAERGKSSASLGASTPQKAEDSTQPS